jgi:hypothetical protein
MIRLCFQVDYALSERIADSAQLCTTPLSFAKPVYMIRRAFRPHSMWFHTVLSHFRLVIQYACTGITLQPLGRWIRDVPTFQIWCPHIHIPSDMSIMTPRRPSASYPCDYSLIFYFHSIYSILYILHTLAREIQVPTSPHRRKSIRNSI